MNALLLIHFSPFNICYISFYINMCILYLQPKHISQSIDDPKYIFNTKYTVQRRFTGIRHAIHAVFVLIIHETLNDSILKAKSLKHLWTRLSLHLLKKTVK